MWSSTSFLFFFVGLACLKPAVSSPYHSVDYSSWWNYGDVYDWGQGCQDDVGGYTGEALPDLCPKIEKCTHIQGAEFKKCATKQDCTRREVCCQNPCTSQMQCLLMLNQDIPDNFPEDHFMICPTVRSCSDFRKEHAGAQTCEEDKDCTRRERCCAHPCDSHGKLPEKLCLRTVFSYPAATHY